MRDSSLAAIDLGTNSCRLLIADMKGNELFKCAVPTRLGEGMSKNNCFTDEAMARGIDCLCMFKMHMDEYNVQQYRAVATAACRMAMNGAEFVRKVKQQANIDLEVIDGYEEARLNLLGAMANVKDETVKYVVVYDLGGGSTEITLATKEINPKILHTVSIPWGARNSSEKFDLNDYDAVKAEKLAKEIHKYSESFVADAKLDKYRDKLCFVATSSTPLRLTHIVNDWNPYERTRADGVMVATQDFDRAIENVRKMSYNERLEHSCIGQSRAEIFNAACVIFSQIYKDLKADKIIASLKSAVDGIIMELKNGTN